MTEYSQTLVCGYSAKERHETIRGTILRHKEMEEKVGVESFYIGRNYPLEKVVITLKFFLLILILLAG